MDMAKATKKKAPSVASQQPKSKCWLFTLNNPTPEEGINPDLVDYAVVGSETCPTTGTWHFQGYAIFKAEKRLSALKKIMPRAHWTKADGTPMQNSNYCKKGEQPKAEWDAHKEKGPNWGLNAEFMEIGAIPQRKAASGTKEERQNNVARQAMECDTVHEGMALLKRELSFEYLRFGESMERNLKRAKTEVFQSPFELTSFNINPLIFEGKSILLWGTNNSGKTNYALAHFKNPLFCSHIDVLKQLSPDHDGIVFDDMKFSHWPVESVIHLLDYDFPRDINCRYVTAHIPAKMRKVFTHNTENPFYKTGEIDPEQQAAVERRLQRIHVNNKIY